MALDKIFERFSGDILHDDPLIVHAVGADVVERDEIRVLQVKALRDPTEFDVEIAPDELRARLPCRRH